MWAASTYLDPRFKQLSFGGSFKANLEATKSRLSQQLKPVAEPDEPATEMTEVQVTSLPDSIWESHDQTVQRMKKHEVSTPISKTPELDAYEDKNVLLRHQDPLSWWKANELTLPELSRLAKKYLACPATSTPSERLFSKAGQLICQRRANISDKNINRVLFVNKNN